MKQLLILVKKMKPKHKFNMSQLSADRMDHSEYEIRPQSLEIELRTKFDLKHPNEHHIRANPF